MSSLYILEKAATGERRVRVYDTPFLMAKTFIIKTYNQSKNRTVPDEVHTPTSNSLLKERFLIG